MDNLSGISEISFICNGIGGVILRQLINKDSAWHKKMRIGKIVQINPPNRGCRILEKIGKVKIFRWILGPILTQYETSNLMSIPRFPRGTNFGILCTHNPIIDYIADYIPRSWQSLIFRKEDAFLAGAKDAVNIKVFHPNPCASKKVVKFCINFIKNGDFTI